MRKKFWKKVLWTDETKVNLYRSDEKTKVWRRKGTDYYPKQTSSSVELGGVSVLAGACMDASRIVAFKCIDDGSSRMNSEVYRNILSANLQRNAS